jgi:cell shape-determining protein MreC
MLTNTEDLLNISLTIFIVLLGFMLVLLVFYMILVFRDVSKVTSKFEKTVKEPLGWLEQIITKISPVIKNFVDSDKDKK